VSIAPVTEQRDALHYAPPPPLRRRRVFRRVAFLLALLIAVGAGIHWFPLLREHVLLQLLQRRCLNHTAGPDEVVFEPDPAAAKRLFSDKRYQAAPRSSPCAFLVPQYWSDLYARLSPPGLRSDATVFLGRMSTADGQEFLVAIDLTFNALPHSYPEYGMLMTSRVIEPHRLARPRLVFSATKQFIASGIPGTLKAGRRDLADASHLTLLNDRVDGWLRNDGSMTLVPRAEWQPGREFPVREVTPPAPSSPGSLPTSGRPGARPSASPASR
jgi:hypothetical protein